MSYRTGFFIDEHGRLIQWVDTGEEWNAPRDQPENRDVDPWVHQKEAGQPTCWHRVFQPPHVSVRNPRCV